MTRPTLRIQVVERSPLLAVRVSVSAPGSRPRGGIACPNILTGRWLVTTFLAGFPENTVRLNRGTCSRSCVHLGVSLAFWMIAAATVWPVLAHFREAIPQGGESAATVPLLNLWTLGWNAERVSHGWTGFWDGRFFHPFHGSLALSEPIATTQLVAPVVWCGESPVAAYNIFLIFTLWLNGIVTWSILRARGYCWPIALLGGWTMLRLPFAHAHLGVLQLIPVAGICATIHFTAQAFETGCRRSFRRWNFLWAGASLGLTYWTCAYYGLFTALLLPVCVCLTRWKWMVRHFAVLLRAVKTRTSIPNGSASELRGCLAGLVLAAVLIGPVALAQRHALSDPAYERSEELIRDLSALPSDYLETPFPELLRFAGWLVGMIRRAGSCRPVCGNTFSRGQGCGSA